MKKEIKTYSVVCDCCETELFDNGIRTNGGKFEEPYLQCGNIDLCYTCAGKIFYRDVAKKIPEDTLKGFIESLRVKSGFGGVPLPDIMLFGGANIQEQSATITSLDDLDKPNLTNELNKLKDL